MITLNGYKYYAVEAPFMFIDSKFWKDFLNFGGDPK